MFFPKIKTINVIKTIKVPKQSHSMYIVLVWMSYLLWKIRLVFIEPDFMTLSKFLPKFLLVGESFTTVWVFLILLICTFKNGWNGKF